MKNRILILTVVVLVAICVGVTMTVQSLNKPVMNKLLMQQDVIIKTQQNILDQFVQRSGSSTGSLGQQGLEQRIIVLDKKVAELTNLLKSLQQGGPMAGQRPSAPQDDYTTVFQIDIGKSPIKGNPEAPITLVEFVDIQCPFCSRFHSFSEDALKAFPDKIRYVVKNFPLPFHPQARPAAKAAFAAGEQGKYYEMLDLMLNNNRDLSDGKFIEFATQLGLNIDKFKQDLKDKDAAYDQFIMDDMNLADKVQVRGTPTFFLQGHKTPSRDVASLQKEIEAILKDKK